MSDYVYAFSPRKGDWFFVCEGDENLADYIGSELSGDLCDACGSFYYSSKSEGYPTGYTVAYSIDFRVKCANPACGTEYTIHLKPESEVIF